KMLERFAPEYGFEVTLILDIHNNVNGSGFTAENFRDVHAAIEFTAPEAAVGNLEKLAVLRVPTVAGTTGWFGQLDHIRQLFENNHAGLVYSPNYSIGVNIFQRVVAEAAAVDAAAARLRSVGLGDPPQREERRTLWHPARSWSKA
ncbi:MAG: hypothetical protein QM757_06555, partial [Paludibaculum sp.]